MSSPHDPRDNISEGPAEQPLMAMNVQTDDDHLTANEMAALELTVEEVGALSSDSLHEVGPSRSLAGDAWRRFKRNRLATVGLVIVVILVLVAIFGPLVVQDPTKLTANAKAAPSIHHPFGTDALGRDELSRVVYGIRLSLFIGLVATFMETIIGVLVGATSGWFRGWPDTVLMRLVDVMLGIPYLVLALALVSAIGRGVSAVVITLAVTAWLQTARTVRAGFLSARDLEYVEAAKTTGVPTHRIIYRHVLPNVFQPIIVLVAVGIGGAILAEAALSFLGVGVVPPTPSLGLSIAESQSYFSQAPHLLIFPGLAIIFTVLGFLLVGDGLRDALDVKDV